MIHPRQNPTLSLDEFLAQKEERLQRLRKTWERLVAEEKRSKIETLIDWEYHLKYLVLDP